MLATGALNLTTVRLLAPHLTAGEPPPGARVRPREGQVGGGGDRRQPRAPARRGGQPAQAPGTAGRARVGIAGPPASSTASRRIRAGRRHVRRFGRRVSAPRSVAGCEAAIGPIRSRPSGHAQPPPPRRPARPRPLPAPAHDRRRHAREAPPRQGSVAPRDPHRRRRRRSSTGPSPRSSSSSRGRSSPPPTRPPRPGARPRARATSRPR